MPSINFEVSTFPGNKIPVVRRIPKIKVIKAVKKFIIIEAFKSVGCIKT